MDFPVPNSFDNNSTHPRALSQDVNVYAPQSQSLDAGLYFVSTPIGNLRDISLRALDVLSSADLVLAEDTRVSRKLFSAYGLKTPLSAYHDHNAAKRVPNLVERIEDGEAIALISDAGTPMVSDPGFKLGRACIEAELNVIAIPGASAVLGALVVSGLPCDKFMFAGFLPAKSGARQTQLRALMDVPATLIFYESGGRLSAFLADALLEFGDRPVVIARELTKKYEEVLRGSLSEMIESLAGIKLRGEIVVLIGPPTENAIWNEAQIKEALKLRIPDIGVKRASEEIAGLSGHKKRDIYMMALKLKDEN